MYPRFSLWCGSERTADWHLRYNAACCVYGHLHIPRTTYYDGVRFEEVSVGTRASGSAAAVRTAAAGDHSDSTRTTSTTTAHGSNCRRTTRNAAEAMRRRLEERRARTQSSQTPGTQEGQS